MPRKTGCICSNNACVNFLNIMCNGFMKTILRYILHDSNLEIVLIYQTPRYQTNSHHRRK